MNHTTRWLAGGLLAALIMIVFSLPIHGLLFGSEWDSVGFTRGTDTWQVIPGAAIATAVFGVLLSWGYAKLHTSVPGDGRNRKGFNYGLIVFLIFIPFAEVWNYLQLELPFLVVIAGMLHYVITLPLGGMAIAAMYGDSLDESGAEQPRHQESGRPAPTPTRSSI